MLDNYYMSSAALMQYLCIELLGFLGIAAIKNFFGSYIFAVAFAAILRWEYPVPHAA